MRRILATLAAALIGCTSASTAIVTPPPVTTMPILLTFDDGPDPIWTPHVLSVLSWKHAHAIFCVTGEHAQMFPDLVRRIVAEGHQLCVHSWDHPHILTLDSAHQIGQIARTYDLLVSLVGAQRVVWWRAPYGQSRVALDGYAQSRGLTAIGWHAQGSDWATGIQPAEVESLEESNVDGLGAVPLVNHADPPHAPDGVAVVLLHDARGENHTTASVDRWPGTMVLAAFTDRYTIAEPPTP